MNTISRRKLFGIALAGLAGCKCASTNRSMDLPLLGNAKPYHERFQRAELSSLNPICRTINKNFRMPSCFYEEYDNEFLLENGIIIFHVTYNIYIKLESKKEHDYEEYIKKTTWPDIAPNNYYEIFNLDTGESAITWA
jgi:hypothetical protein